MIDSTSLIGAAASSPVTSTATRQKDPRLDAALAAQQRADAEKTAQDQQMAEIRQKGFRTFVRDTMAENFRQKLREKMLKAMGLDENSLAKLPPAARDAIEQSIEAALKQQLDEVKAGPGQLKAGASGAANGTGTAAGQADQAQSAQAVQAQASNPVTGQNLPGQKKSGIAGCPLIPILAWPGGPSLLG